ncbi:T9SS type A sorting domain-containing protein [Hymenobacter gelipurpurascens]|nr:T9SS type A sorting domain-containing protein [Hymenobacter gelipurpurascens]
MKQLLLWITLVLTASFSVLAQAPDPSFRPGEVYQTGLVKAVATFPDGSTVVLGKFAFVNGGRAPNLVRFTAEGYYDSAFRPDITDGTANLLTNIRPLPGGKLLLVGIQELTIGGHTSRTLLVLNPDGTPDTHFTFNSYVYAGYALSGSARTAVQPDGKILLSGASFTHNGVQRSGLVRLNLDGSYDTSFAPNGLSIGDISTIALQPDGRIVVGGSFEYVNNAVWRRLARFNTDGTQDLTLRTDNYVTINELLVQPDGKILVGGLSNNSFGTNYLISGLHRLLPDGTRDPVFAAPNFANGDNILNAFDAHNMLLQPDGRIVAAVMPYTAPDQTPQPRLVRYLPTGQPDPTWPTDLRAAGSLTTMAFRPDGTLLAGGSFTALANRAGCLTAFGPNGQLHPGFVPKFHNPGTVEALALQPDGKVLVVGDFSEINGVEANKVSRLLASGDVDPTFRGPASITGPLLSVAAQPDGRILIGGDLNSVNGEQRLGVARLLADGTFDPTFNVTGLYYNGPSTRQRVLCMEFLSDGKILLGGSLFHIAGTTYRSGILRVQPDGTLDPSFTAKLGDGGGEVHALKQQGAGLLVGGVWFGPRPEVLTRLLPDGSQDPTFANLKPDPTPSGIINSIAELPDGRLVVAGRLLVAFQRATYHVVRLTPNGAQDAGFSSSLREESYVSGLVCQPNGRLLVWGSLGTSTAPVYLQRLESDGHPDLTFNMGQGPDRPVKSMLLQPDGALLLGGAFQQINTWQLAGVARLVVPFVLKVADPGVAHHMVKAFPNPVQDQLHVELAAGARHMALQDVTGRTVWQRAAPPVVSAVPVGHLPAGVYVLQVTYHGGLVTRRVVVQ